MTKIKESSVQLNLSHFAESISYIRLSDNPLLRDITTSNLRIINDTIYIDMDNRDNIYKYSPDGKFIKTLFIKGQGAREAILSLSEPAAFNVQERYVTFNSNGGYVNYSFDGNFLERKNDYLVDGNLKKIETYFNNYCIYRLDHHVRPDVGGNRLGPYLFYAEDVNNGAIFYAYPNPGAAENPSFQGHGDLIPSDMNFVHIDSTLWYKHYALDTLFSRCF